MLTAAAQNNNIANAAAKQTEAVLPPAQTLPQNVQNAVDLVNDLATRFPNEPEFKELGAKLSSGQFKVDKSQNLVLRAGNNNTKIVISNSREYLDQECGKGNLGNIDYDKNRIVIPTVQAALKDKGFKAELAAVSEVSGHPIEEYAIDTVASTYVHELAHANGATEFGAWKRDKEFLANQGYPAATDKEVLDTICQDSYSKKDWVSSFIEMKTSQGTKVTPTVLKKFAQERGIANSDVEQGMKHYSLVKRFGNGETKISQASFQKTVDKINKFMEKYGSAASS